MGPKNQSGAAVAFREHIPAFKARPSTHRVLPGSEYQRRPQELQVDMHKQKTDDVKIARTHLYLNRWLQNLSKQYENGSNGLKHFNVPLTYWHSVTLQPQGLK